MFSVIVQHPSVYQNIMTLLKVLKSQQLKKERYLKISCYCNPKTGELRSHRSAAMITIDISFDMDHQSITWQTEGEEPLSFQARAHLIEMAQILNKAFRRIDHLEQLTHLDWRGPTDPKEGEQMLKEALYDISREEAEQILLQQPVGTFLFRRDPYAITLQEILKRGLKRSIHCYTLTYLDFERIVRDRTIIFCHHKWTFYDDDPTLSGPTWDSIKELLKSLGPAVKSPLPALKMPQV